MTDATSAGVPLCVDLDETLVNTDTLVESALQLLRRNPFEIVNLVLWLLKGKAHLKEQVARRTQLDIASLPFNTAFVDWLENQRSGGRELVLVTAANERIADGVADHLPLFSRVLASDAHVNLKAERKRQRLVELYGQGGYDYAGNSTDDLPAWRDCRRAVLVNTSTRVTTKARQQASVETVFPRRDSQVAALLKAVRPHQWSKNVLLFVSILVSHSYSDGALLASTLVAFISFCLCSSAVYLINDLLDLDADRKHPTKCNRPFASGRLSVSLGCVAIPLLLLASASLALGINPGFSLALLVYFGLTLLYSLVLKKVALLDVITLSGLYTIRLLAGAAVAASGASVWLVSFSMFLFTSLAMAKRYAELKAMSASSDTWVDGRGYHVGDLAIIGHLGTASGIVSTLVLAQYIDTPEVVALYSEPHLMWLLCPLLLYWIGRIWLVASRGQLDQDPVIYATRDYASYIVLFLGLLTMLVAL